MPSIVARKTGSRNRLLKGDFAASGKITALTAYDFIFAKILDACGIDIILVGDSVATIVQGYENTLPVSLDEMVYHCRCVSRAVTRALVVGDLPFMSYQSSSDRALESAGRLIKEGGVAAVKLEGGIFVAQAIEKIVQCDIPVMGHVGLTPQSFHRMGGHKLQGRVKGDRLTLKAGSRERIIEDALAVEGAGAFAVVLEGMPAELAAEITERLSVPTIGIGAGLGCDGQILVTHDMLGMNPDFRPKFVKAYADLSDTISQAVKSYMHEVRQDLFPAPQHTFSGSAPRGDAPKRTRLKVV